MGDLREKISNVILEARGVSYTYDRAAAEPVVRGASTTDGQTGPHMAVGAVDLTISTGELVGIVGPNGSGKTTLLRLLLGTLTPSAGQALAFGSPAAQWRRRELARLVGVVSQREEPAFPLRVKQAVLFGRYPHMGPLGAPTKDDLTVVDQALERCDVKSLSDRWVATLSGGEWQRVRIARALAQDPRALVLDEGTASLDIRHEMEVFELVSELVHEGQLAGLLVTHHVNLAARFVDRIVVMDAGAAVAVGKPEEVLSPQVFEQVFGWPVAQADWRGVPQFVALRRGEQGAGGGEWEERERS
jgi:iron complex transport system ATP-binding protein